MHNHQPMIAVIGDGVAGCCSVLALRRRGLEPIWIRPDHSRSNVPWPESVDGHAVELLSQFLDVERLLSSCRYPIEMHHSCWGNDCLVSQVKARLNQQKNGGYLVDKSLFLKALRLVSGRDCAIVNATLRSIRVDESGFLLGFRDGSWRRCQAVVLATGANAPIEHCLSRPVITDQFLGCHWILRRPSGCLRDIESVSLIEAAPSGWWYGVVKPDECLSLSYFTEFNPPGPRVNSVEFLRDHLNGTLHLKQWIQSGQFRLFTKPYLFKQTCSRMASYAGIIPEAGHAAWFAVGDAALTHDPLAAYGVTSAIWSALQASKSLAQVLSDCRRDGIDAYHRVITAMARQLDLDRSRIYASEQRFSSEPFWRHRSSTLQAS